MVALLIFVFVSALLLAVFYLRDKNKELAVIQRGFCPSCKHDTIRLDDTRSAGCSGTKSVTYRCDHCDYTNTFTLPSSGCGI